MALIAVLTSVSAFALPSVVFTGNGGANGVGAFNADTAGVGSVADFYTFCLESGEHVTLGATYYYEVSNEAKYNNAFPSVDPISKATAWLFVQFATGMPGYTLAQQNALQQAIWYAEGEANGASNSLYTNAVNAVGVGATFAQREADALLADNGAQGVGVMNVWADNDPTHRGQQYAVQDMLIITGTPGQQSTVPDGGATAALLGLALGAVGLLHRRSLTASALA